MKPVYFLSEAEAEMAEAARFYEQRQESLGKRFVNAIREAVQRARVQPQLYPFVFEDVRRCLTRFFPFGVLFREQTDRIVVVAVMHLHRDPDYWKSR